MQYILSSIQPSRAEPEAKAGARKQSPHKPTLHTGQVNAPARSFPLSVLRGQTPSPSLVPVWVPATGQKKGGEGGSVCSMVIIASTGVSCTSLA